MHVVLNWYWVDILIKVTAKIRQVNKIDLVCNHFKHPESLLITNRKPPILSLYTFKPVFRTTLKTPWGKLEILLGMKLTSDITLPLRLEVNNDISIYFFYHRCGQ